MDLEFFPTHELANIQYPNTQVSRIKKLVHMFMSFAQNIVLQETKAHQVIH